MDSLIDDFFGEIYECLYDADEALRQIDVRQVWHAALDLESVTYPALRGELSLINDVNRVELRCRQLMKSLDWFFDEIKQCMEECTRLGNHDTKFSQKFITEAQSFQFHLASLSTRYEDDLALFKSIQFVMSEFERDIEQGTYGEFDEDMNDAYYTLDLKVEHQFSDVDEIYEYFHSAYLLSVRVVNYLDECINQK